jgi:CHAD domain-containing protein
MDRTPTHYALATDAPGRRALKRLEARFRARRQPYPPHRTTWLDTFDWRLFNDGASLAFEEGPGQCSLVWRDADGVIRHGQAAQRHPHFADDLPAGPLRERAEAVIGVRRLFPVARTEAAGETLRLLDGNNRTILRIDLERVEAQHPSRAARHLLLPRLRLTPSAGSDAVIPEVRQILEAELGLKPDPSTVMHDAMEATGVRATARPGKARASITPRLSAAEAARRIQRSLLRTLRLNERGAREALDPEFLHDYRVALRRIRTGLAQLRGVFPERSVARFRRDFRWLGELTNPARDMDVFRIALAGHARLLPPQHRHDIDPLIDFVLARQQAEQKRLADGLRSTRCRSLLRDWSAFLRTKPTGRMAPDALRPVTEVAAERIEKRFARVLKKGKSLKSSSPDLKFHRLRVECKRLRYLLEFFQDLYRAEEAESFIAPLKKLQDTLGEFNDLRVQRGALRPFAQDLARTDGAPVECLIAIGRLEERLQQRQDKLRKRFRRRFAEFVAARSRERLTSMLAAPREKESPPPARAAVRSA